MKSKEAIILQLQIRQSPRKSTKVALTQSKWLLVRIPTGFPLVVTVSIYPSVRSST